MIERDGDLARVAGTLTIENAVTVCEALKQELGTGGLTVDFGGLTEVDSSALSVMFVFAPKNHLSEGTSGFHSITSVHGSNHSNFCACSSQNALGFSTDCACNASKSFTIARSKVAAVG